MTLKACTDCHYYGMFGSKTYPIHACTLKMKQHAELDITTGQMKFPSLYHSQIRRCTDEREDSKGFFGLFRDYSRCGIKAVNFIPKQKDKEDESH